MTKDRLPNLLAARRLNEEEDEALGYCLIEKEDLDYCLIEDEDLNYSLIMERCTYLKVFLQEANAVRILIQRIQNCVVDVNKKHFIILSSEHKIDERIRKDLDILSSEIRDLRNKVWSRLKNFQKKSNLEKNRTLQAEERIRNIQHATLSRAFVEIMRDYNLAQVEYQDCCKRRFQRQLEITNEECKGILTSNGLFTHPCDHLADVEARHDDIVKLEGSILEMHSLFMEMAMLIGTKGDIMNRIEANVMASKDYIESADIKTGKALGYKF